MGNRCTERPPDPVLYGGRLSGGFVNRVVIEKALESTFGQFPFDVPLDLTALTYVAALQFHCHYK